MIKYSLSEVSLLPEVMENIAGCGNDYPLVARILEDISKKGKGCDIDSLVRNQIVKYLCNCNNCTHIDDYEVMGINDILYDEPLSEMPLYLSCYGNEYLKRVAATWRLMIGR
jgi:hypothetical protein